MPRHRARTLRRADLPSLLFATLVAVLVAGTGTGLALGAPRTDPAPAAPAVPRASTTSPASDAAAERSDTQRSDAALVAHVARDVGDWGLAVAPDGHVTLPVWFVAGGPSSLTLSPQAVDATAALGGAAAVSRLELARAAMELTLTALPTDPALATGAPEGTHVQGVALDGDVLVVDVSARLTAVSGTRVREEALAQQLAHTALDVVGARAVRLRIEGRDVTRLWGHIDWSEPITVHGLPIEFVTAESACHRAIAVADGA